MQATWLAPQPCATAGPCSRYQPTPITTALGPARTSTPAPLHVAQAAGFSGRSSLCSLAPPPQLLKGCLAHSNLQQRRADAQIVSSTDYVASASDEGVLRLPSRTELEPNMVTHVFGYPRNLQENYMIGKVIGAGSFGVVRECIEKASGRHLAVKIIPKIPKRGAPTPRYLLKLRTEVEIMQQLGYSLDAVNLKDVYEDNDSLHLVMDLCEGGALLERIESHKYSEKYIAQLVRCILRFISQCHAKGIIYRDVKPDNFLFLRTDDESPLKATDFGLSIRHWPDEPKLTSRSGTPAYMSPELVLQSYDEKCDIWSVGMLAYQLLTGRFPFWEDVRTQSLSDVWKSILTLDVNWDAPELKALTPGAVNFLKALLKRDPALRPSAMAALEHPWICEDGAAADLPLQGSVVQRLQRFSTYGHLKQIVLKLIMEQIQEEGRQGRGPTGALGILQELFNQLDTDRSGTVSLEELSRGLRSQGYVLEDEEIEQLVRKVDFDHDGNIQLAEFMTTLIDWDKLQKDPRWTMYLDHAFRRLDFDGDGSISLDELVNLLPASKFTGSNNSRAAERNGTVISIRKVARSSSGALSDGEAERRAEAKLMLREADSNGDGRISKEEFYDLLKDSHAPDNLELYDDRLALRVRRKLASQAEQMKAASARQR